MHLMNIGVELSLGFVSKIQTAVMAKQHVSIVNSTRRNAVS